MLKCVAKSSQVSCKYDISTQGEYNLTLRAFNIKADIQCQTLVYVRLISIEIQQTSVITRIDTSRCSVTSRGALSPFFFRGVTSEKNALEIAKLHKITQLSPTDRPRYNKTSDDFFRVCTCISTNKMYITYFYCIFRGSGAVKRVS